ncbi:fungal-specific transcription factor domain-containing protein [Exophiala viscosa]|uniref:Fungal-specific transcription factor domain-containing protein n=1 Tax=Exophiala viscosa TaxID=2486360 RepID=A0AAN6DSI2_9EURO|nr:fungal-specific transcription factor domain-containing protein [Exophiala viscosa]
MATNSTDAQGKAPRASQSQEEVPKVARASRISRACVRCRARKDRCDGVQPQCSNCVTAGQPCLYLAANKKRGLPEGYVRGLEKLWAIVMQTVEGLEDATQRIIAENEDELLRLWNHHRHGEDLHKTWKESTVLSELERLLSRLEEHQSSNLKRKRDREDNEENDSSSLSMPPNLGPVGSAALTPRFRTVESSDDAPYADVQESAPPHMFAQGLPGQRLSTGADAELARLPDAMSSLLTHYFTYTHCWFPILDRAHTLKKFYEHTRSHNPTPAGNSDLAYLWAICAYCTQQRSSLADRDADVDTMRRKARRCIPSDDGPFALGHTQALVILVLLEIGMGNWTSAWILIGLAVRALLDVIDSGGMLQAKQSTEPAREQSWTGTFQACFILDTLICMRLRRPAHLRKEHLEPGQLLAEDGLEEWGPWNGDTIDLPVDPEPAFIKSCFNRLTETFMLANDVLPAERVAGLQRLSDAYPFQISEIKRRAPHHMVLQASYFVVVAISSSPETRAKLTAQFVRSLDVFHNAWSEAAGIPAILTALFHTINVALDIPRAVQSLYSSRRHDEVLPRLAMIWPGFKPFEEDVTRGSQRSAASAGVSLDDSVPNRGQQPQYHLSLPFPSTGGALYYDKVDAPIVASNAGDLQAGEFHDLSAYRAMDPLLHDPPVIVDYGVVNAEVPDQPQPANANWANSSMRQGTVVRTATSPSFDGDEIDALFDEMAQLDTTEWSTDRMQGLRDFGFADESTFEAFCNDPDRLILSNGYAAPTFGYRTNTFAHDAQATISTELDNQIPDTISQMNPFEIPNNNWRPQS